MKRNNYLLVGFSLFLSILKCGAVPIQSSNEYYEYDTENNPSNQLLTKCPEGFTLLGKKCFYVEIVDKQDWFGFGDTCREKSGVRARVENIAEMERLNDHLLSLETEDMFWISGDDIISEEKFVWGDQGDEMTYLNWADDQQNNDHLNCVNLLQIGGEYLMAVDSCSKTKAFVCETEPQKTSTDDQTLQERKHISVSITMNGDSKVTQSTNPLEAEKTTSSVGKECPYNFTKLDEKCYYIEHEKRLNWYAAHRQCKQMDSQIVTIENAEEMKDIANHLRDHLYDRNRKDSWGFVGFWTGGNDLGSEGKFHWVSTGEKVNYANWYENEPNNNSDNEHCLEISYMENDYYMNDHVCSREKFFICEAEPKKNSLPIPEIIGSCAELKLMRLNLEAESRLINLLHSQQQCPETDFNSLEI